MTSLAKPDLISIIAVTEQTVYHTQRYNAVNVSQRDTAFYLTDSGRLCYDM